MLTPSYMKMPVDYIVRCNECNKPLLAGSGGGFVIYVPRRLKVCGMDCLKIYYQGNSPLHITGGIR